LHRWRNPTKAVRESHISFFNTTPLVFAAQIQGRKGGTVKSKTITCHVLAKTPPVGAMIVLGSSSSGFPFHLTIDYTDLPF